jgi:acyl-CoA hydrolase/N-acetylglutamate synthase-like GNAT family acetyltransferase
MNTTTPRLGYDPTWKDRYAAMVATPEQAIRRLEPGQRVFIGTGCGEPVDLVDALTKRARELPDTEIIHLLTMGLAPYAHPDLSQYFRVNSFFIAENVRSLIQEGLGDYTPIFLSDIPRLFHSGQLPLDVALIQVSPPDEQGMCSLGVSVDIVKSAAENASLVLAQVNPNMPRVHGDSFMHVFDFDLLVPTESPLLEVKYVDETPQALRIAEYIAALIEDGSTLELGIGRIPQALVRYLRDKKDLGIHTEMFTDGIIELIDSGVVNGNRKSVDRGKVVASFCIGTRRLYEYMNDNPVFSFRPTEYVNDPFVISRQEKMVAINSALEVDLSGQVCSDSIGPLFFSGVGGQVDFNRGAAQSRGGKAIIALPSVTSDGKTSRLVTHLSKGAGVVTTRADVHYVVTEYGVAYLHGKSVQERAMALISIAHPDHRARLMREAVEARYLAADYASVEGKVVIGPRELSTTHLLADGTVINVRPIHPTDEPRMRQLMYSLSRQTMYYRFMSEVKRLPRRQLQGFIYIDHRNEIAIVVTVPEAYGEEILGVGRYYLNPKTNLAEVAFVVQDEWQHRGIGTFLLDYLISIARRNGIRGFTAEVLLENKAMQKVFNRSKCTVQSVLLENVYSYELIFK